MSKTAGHKMEAHINFFPKTKQLRKFKLFESKEVTRTLLTFLAIHLGRLRQSPI